MNEIANTADETQPVRVHTEQIGSEETSSDKLPQARSARTDEIPEWLTEFAAQPAHDLEANGEKELQPVEEPELIPVVLETAEWQEPETELEVLVSPSPEIVTTPGHGQDLQALLDQGHYAAAAELIRKTAINLRQIEASLRMLRPHLILKEKLLPLWDVYKELSEKLLQENNQTQIGG